MNCNTHVKVDANPQQNKHTHTHAHTEESLGKHKPQIVAQFIQIAREEIFMLIRIFWQWLLQKLIAVQIYLGL